MASKDNKPLQQLSSNGVSAKELARSLGLVKRRPSSSTSRMKGQENGRKSRQHFAYLIVLDFESTCWKDKKMSYGPEIIEFPAVLLNTSTGELESEFQMFVQPSEHRKLSEFCTELTGITQTQVDEGVPVGTCLMLFGRWLQEMRDQKGFMFPCDQVQIKNQRSQNMESSVKWCTFVTWSDWDLGNCLKNECHRKQLRMPHPLRSWIDLRVTYKNFYSRKPQGLAGALQDLGIKFAGREHSGLDDARNTARLTWRMISDGCVMQITKSIDGALSAAGMTCRVGHMMNEPASAHLLTRGKMVQNLWNLVMKNGLSQTDSRANNLPGPQISVQDAHCTTEQTRICESLNFIRTQSGVHGGLQVQKGSTLKRKITELGSRDPQDKMTKIKQKEFVLRMQENRVELHDNWRHMGDVKRTASDSNVSFIRCAVPGNITTCLLSPATSLNKTVKESLGFHLRSETPKDSAAGLLMKRGLVKQTLRYNQHKPLASHDWQIRLVTEERQRSASTRPCKASNVEPQAMTTPLFRVPVNQTFLADRHQIKEEPYNNDNVKYHSAPREDVLQKVEKKAATVSVEAKNSASRLTTPCAARKLITNAFTPPLCGRVNKTHQASPPVACFNGGSVTPPLCHCGRRTRRRSVINPGPNQGRAFFACSLNHARSRLNSSADKKNSKSGCNFFRWEVHL